MPTPAPDPRIVDAMTNPAEVLDALLADPALDVDDDGRVVCVPCDVALAPAAAVGLAVQRIREHLDR